MANSLLPDLGETREEKKKKKSAKIIAEFDYDNQNSEVDGAMKTFQQMFSSKRGILSVVAYSLLLAAAVVMVIMNPTMYFVYAAILICAGGLILSLTAKRRIRRKVIEALDKMDPETYHCRVFSDKIEIETIIQKKEIPQMSDEVSDNKTDKDPESEDPVENAPEENTPIMSVFRFGEDMLDFAENKDSFLLVVARQQFYCFPKRCLSEEQQNIIRDHLVEKTRSAF